MDWIFTVRVRYAAVFSNFQTAAVYIFLPLLQPAAFKYIIDVFDPFALDDEHRSVRPRPQLANLHFSFSFLSI